MWPFKKKDDEEPEEHTSTLIVPIPTLLRNILYDSLIKDPEVLASKLGLPSISEEVAEMEEEASQDRLEKIEVLLPMIETHAKLAAKVVFAGYSTSLPIQVPDEEMEEAILAFFELVAFASSLSCLSTLVDLDLLETNVTGLDLYGK